MALIDAHTVTVYNALGETDRIASYARTVLAGVRIETTDAAVASVAGGSSTGGVTAFVPGGLAGYVDPHDWDGTAGWTLRVGDLMVVGECTSDVPGDVSRAQLEAAREVYRITGVETHRLFSAAVHHFEVAGA